MPSHTSHLTRRQLCAALFGVAAGAMAGCAPVRIVLDDYPERFGKPYGPTDLVLHAFAVTVAPCQANVADPARALADPFFPFARFRSWLASDLCRRAGQFRGMRFDQLDTSQRVHVITEGLQADAVTRKVYTGAVFLIQLAAYGAIYGDVDGAPGIRYDGTYRFQGLAAVTYPEPETFLPAALTADGNPV